ncbi:SCO4848 family membrane protein [Herbiconiux sp. A18JL235]|uniref:SCO4848 family membrane protein n=1 Tax=Herbiconiux sp. A18JL235 TaxID=3152363 RepID=A0AB39BE77_9MICO
MITTLAILLFVNAGWNALVWPQFFKRITRDPRSRDAQGKPTRFLVVHVVLIAVSLVIALASLLAGIAALAGAW